MEPDSITNDDIILLAYALEYECNDKVQSKVNKVLEKVENQIHIDTFIGNRLCEYGRIMGWSKD